MKREDLHVGFWVRAYTNSLKDDNATFLGQVSGFGKMGEAAYGGVDSVILYNSHGSIEVPVDCVKEIVVNYPPPGAGETVCVMVTNHPEFTKKFHAGENRLYVRPKNREILDSIAQTLNERPGHEWKWYVKEVILLPPVKAPKTVRRDPENQPRLL